MNKIVKNVCFGFGGQLLILAMGIVVRRFVLVAYGSEVNGITATVAQILTYIALMEAGVGNATRNCLYKNIAADDKAGICTTVSATKKYFRNMVPLYVFCVLTFMLVFPMVMETDVPARTVRLVILLQGSGFVVDYLFANAYIHLLWADGKSYITAALATMERTIAGVMQIILIEMGYDVVGVQFSYFLAFSIKAVIINIYIRKKYPWLKRDPKAGTKDLPQRGAFMVHEVSQVIFNSTDVVLISVFCSVKEASVYTIYNMVFVALCSISEALFRGIDFNLGTQYHRDIEQYKKLHDSYETLFMCFVFAMISAAYIVILPFVRLYTDGVTDVEYARPILPILFALIQLLTAGKLVATKLITVAGKATATIPNTIAETIINLVASVIFVNIFGIEGVLLGTIVALLYRFNHVVLYANRKILKRRPWHTYKMLLINLALFGLVIVCTFAYPPQVENYFQFLFVGALSLMAMVALYLGTGCLLDRNMRQDVVAIGGDFLSKLKR